MLVHESATQEGVGDELASLAILPATQPIPRPYRACLSLCPCHTQAGIYPVLCEPGLSCVLVSVTGTSMIQGLHDRKTCIVPGSA